MPDQTSTNDEEVAVAPHGSITPLSWRDVYSAVGQMEERMTKVLERIESKFDNVVGDHERRLRVLETEGSTEARQALSATKALGVKFDMLVEQVNANTLTRRGQISMIVLGQRVAFLVFAALGAIAVLLDIMSRYGVTTAH